MLNLNQLRSFYFCALHKNVTKAAEDLSVTQPSLSQQIKAFEEELGFDLFFRNGRSLELTPKGRDLFLKSRPLFSTLDEVENFLNPQQKPQLSYTIGVSDQIERPYVARVVSLLAQNGAINSVKLKVLSDDHGRLKDSFLNGKFDLFLTHAKVKGKNPYHQLEMPVKLVTIKKDFESSRIKQSSLQNLILGLGQKLVLPTSGMQLRSEIDAFMPHLEKTNEIIFESNIVACLTEAIRSGLGCGLIPVPYIYDELKKNKISVLGPEKGFWGHQLFLYNQNKQTELVADAIVKTIQQTDF